MEKTLTIAFGFAFIYLVNFILVSTFIYIYSKLSKRKPKFESTIMTTSSILAVLIIVLNSLTLILFSQNVFLFAISSFVFLGAAIFSLLYKIRKVEKLDSGIVAAGLAIIMNPVWYKILGIM